MPFDSLPGRLGPMPQFQPQVVTRVPKQSAGPAIAAAIAHGVGNLASILDPVKAAQRKLLLAQYSTRTRMLEEYNSGKFPSSDYYIGHDGMPVRMTPMEKQMMMLRQQQILRTQILNKHSSDMDAVNRGDRSVTWASDLDAQLPKMGRPRDQYEVDQASERMGKENVDPSLGAEPQQ